MKCKQNEVWPRCCKSIGGFGYESSVAHLGEQKQVQNQRNPSQLFLACLLIFLSPGFLSSVHES